MLVRALMWILETSQDIRVLRAVNECSATVSRGDYTNKDAVSTFYLVLNRDMSLACKQIGITTTTCKSAPIILSISFPYNDGEHRQFVTSFRENPESSSADVSIQDLPHSPSAAAAVRLSQLLVCDLLALLNDPDVRMNRATHSIDNFDSLRGATALAVWLAYKALCIQNHSSAAIDSLSQLFTHLCRQYMNSPRQITQLCLPLYRALSGFEFWMPGNEQIILSSDGNLRFTRLALHITLKQNITLGRDHFAFAATIMQRALSEWTFPHDDEDIWMFRTLLDRIEAQVRFSMENGWQDCGAISSQFYLPFRLHMLFVPDAQTFKGDYLPSDLFPHDLVEALSQSRGLITHPADYGFICDLARQSSQLKQHGPIDNNNTGRHTQPSRINSVLTSLPVMETAPSADFPVLSTQDLTPMFSTRAGGLTAQLTPNVCIAVMSMHLLHAERLMHSSSTDSTPRP